MSDAWRNWLLQVLGGACDGVAYPGHQAPSLSVVFRRYCSSLRCGPIGVWVGVVDVPGALSPSLVRKVREGAVGGGNTTNGAGGMIQGESVQLIICVDSERIPVRETSGCGMTSPG